MSRLGSGKGMMLGRLLWWVALLLPWQAWSYVQISGTRVIYPASAREVTLELINKGTTPSLVQVWLDAGDRRIQPGVETLPFLITPPITRIEAQRGQSLRLAYLGQGLPQDRESVFWLNVLEVPPSTKASQAGQNQVQLAFRSRIKLFYRPEGLAGDVERSAHQLSWRLVRQGQGYALRASNPSRYHVSISNLELQTADAKAYSNLSGGMVAPGGSLDFPVERLAGTVHAKAVTFYWLNDYGAREVGRFVFN
ncbi:fimbria/pilus periplasmic chaperone [Aeromonas lusitana]|uniref:Chaperone protein ecpD n=1 Tax=Aeromonas lusitana TaxID=931529 RepID=A0A2M8H5M3_9GAMM|nr:fimbria/pilus periplasmic chaperone [Aeromonas lusitana]PJC91845.1 chaperone protein ecpD [Aeromonas lusitana]